MIRARHPAVADDMVITLSLPFTCCLVSPRSRFDAQVFRVLLLRRLWCPRGLGSQRILLGECGRSGVPRGWSFTQVSLDARVHDLDLPPLERPDNRRIEIIADGLRSWL